MFEQLARATYLAGYAGRHGDHAVKAYLAEFNNDWAAIWKAVEFWGRIERLQGSHLTRTARTMNDALPSIGGHF